MNDHTEGNAASLLLSTSLYSYAHIFYHRYKIEYEPVNGPLYCTQKVIWRGDDRKHHKSDTAGTTHLKEELVWLGNVERICSTVEHTELFSLRNVSYLLWYHKRVTPCLALVPRAHSSIMWCPKESSEV